MTLTSHGHHIPNTTKDDEVVAYVARCGGPGLCKRCSGEAGTWSSKYPKRKPKHRKEA